MDSKRRERIVRFRGIMADLAMKLSEEEVKAMGLIYLGQEDIHSFTNGLDLMDRILKRELISNCVGDLKALEHSLERVGRKDLISTVEEYITKNRLPLVHQQALDFNVSSTNSEPPLATQENEADITKSMVSIG